MERKLAIVGGTGRNTTPLTDLVERTVQEFVKANKLKIKPDFGKPAEYVVHGLHYSRQELIASTLFAGFSDGYNGNPKKYQAPRGIAQQVAKEESSPARAVLEHAQASGDPDVKAFAELLAHMLSPEQQYLAQYRLGWSCKRS